MTVTPDLIDLVLYVFINHSEISTEEVAMAVDIDPVTASEVLAELYRRADIEKKTDRDGTVRWYDPEQTR